MRLREGVLCGLMLWVSDQPLTSADTLRLSGGRTLEGIILEDTASQVKIQVSWKGDVTLSREAVVSIARSEVSDHQRLLRQWQREFVADQRRERRRLALEAAQRARGLVRYQGRWISQDELALIQDRQRREAEAAEERQRRDAEAKLVQERLQTLEEENRRLRWDLDQGHRWWSWWWNPRTIIVQERHQPDPDLFRDEQGNLIRVNEHEGHQFFTTTDGRHVDVQSHDGHLAFTDEQGVHHDLRLAGH